MTTRISANASARLKRLLHTGLPLSVAKEIAAAGDVTATVAHGVDPEVPRPDVIGPVSWFGTVVPHDWQRGDVLVSAHVTPFTPPLELNGEPLISRGVPAFASSGGASRAVEADYFAPWSSVADPSEETPQWLALDLSGVQVSQRGPVTVVLDTPGEPFAGARTSSKGRPVDYVLAGNPAATGPIAPDTGWVPLATVTGNTHGVSVHHLDLSGHNWLRLSVSKVEPAGGAVGVAANLDVHNAAAGHGEQFVFLGDGITAGAAPNTAAAAAWPAGSMGDVLAAGLPGHHPVCVGAGIAGPVPVSALRAALPDVLAASRAKVVCISAGSTEAGAPVTLSPAEAAAVVADILGLVDDVLAAGATPVLATVLSGSASAAALNTGIESLFGLRPLLRRGPDLYGFFIVNTQLSTAPLVLTDPTAEASGKLDGLSGQEHFRRLWAEAILANVYFG